MSRDQFLLITSFFHLVNNESYIPRGQPGHDPLFKLGSVYKRINRFFSSYTPHQYISLDEGRIPWRGHLSFHVYSPDKPVKYGIRAYMPSDSRNGYVSKLKPHTGKSATGPSINGVTYDLVMSLLCDNYYTSPQLFWDLFQLGVNATGTVRSNCCGIPQEIKAKSLINRGELATMIFCVKHFVNIPDIFFLFLL